jgi:hypothetical protein
MNVVKVHETLPYHSLFYHELLCFVLARCWPSICKIFETSGKTFLMPKLSIISPTKNKNNGKEKIESLTKVEFLFQRLYDKIV